MLYIRTVRILIGVVHMLGVCRAMWSVRVLTLSCTSSQAIFLCRDRGETVTGCESEEGGECESKGGGI